MNNQVGALLQKLLENNPNIQNNPQAKEFLEVIRNNDSVRGEQIANNLLQTYGVSKEDALKHAQQFFKL